MDHFEEVGWKVLKSWAKDFRGRYAGQDYLQKFLIGNELDFICQVIDQL